MSKVTLEVGHGPYRDRSGRTGFEKGAKGPNTWEYDEVVCMSDVVSRRLIALGHEVEILDPQETLTRIGSMSWGSDVMVSLHLNAFNRRVQGTETLIHRAGTHEDMSLAAAIQSKLVEALHFRDRGVRRQGLAVLGTVPPSVKACCLTESFFIDSMPDAKTTRENAQKAALAIAAGIHAYLSGS